MMQLRPYQKQCVDAILSAREEGIRRQLVVSATGTGKSLVFSSLPQYLQTGKRMLMVVNAIELVEQGAAHLRRWNPNLSVGIERAGEVTTDEQVVVASVQTIGRAASGRRGKFVPEDFEFLVVDEAHLSIAATYNNVFDHFKVFERDTQCNLIGFTATPSRGDGKAMGAVYERITFNYGLREAIRDGWLSDVRGYRVRTTTDISNVGTIAGDFAQDELGKVVNNPERNKIVVKEFINHGWPRQTLGFTVDIQHAKDLALEFQRTGIPAEAVWGTDPERVRKIADHKAGRTQVLLCSQLLVTGYDDPNVSCILMVRPTKSSTFFQQAIGRGTRLGPGIDNLEARRTQGLLSPNDKQDCLLIDYVDVTSKTGLVTLPTLFGLGVNLNLNGKSVFKVVDKVEELAKARPQIDFSKLEDAAQLHTYVEEASLWQEHFADEVKPYSKLAWFKAPKGNFVLLLPGKNERLVVGEDLIGRWSLWGQVGGIGVDEKYGSLPQALSVAEQIVASLGPRVMSHLRTDAKWTAKKVTDKQRAILRKFRVPESQIDAMTSGQAGAFLTKKFKQKELKTI